jgi:hypothetical protein
MRELVLHFTKDHEWLPSVTQDITDAIHVELADVDAEPEMRLPLDSLLRAYHIGQATFFRRWSEKARADIEDPDQLAEAIELRASWTSIS